MSDIETHEKGRSVADYIRPIAIVVVRRDDGALLLAPGFDPVKNQRFYRPLGGGIEFGELAEDAAKREFQEELGAEITDLRLLGIEENIFIYLGEKGHELVWMFEGRLTDESLYARDVIEADEGGIKFRVEWAPLRLFIDDGVPLYPDALLALLT